MLGNRSDTIPLNSFRSSIKNLGTLTSLMARKAINSCNKKQITHNRSDMLCKLQVEYWCDQLFYFCYDFTTVYSCIFMNIYVHYRRKK